MKGKKIISKHPLNKLAAVGATVAIATALTLNGLPTTASNETKEKSTDKKEDKVAGKASKASSPTNVVYIVLDDSGFPI